MSLTILLAHTGVQLQVDPRTLNSLDSLQSWITKRSGIPVEGQILMTAKGKPVKLQNLLTEKQIFVYDRRAITSETPGKIVTQTARPIPPPFAPPSAPEGPADNATLETWQKVFKDREAWATQVARSIDSMLQQIDGLLIESNVIKRAALIAGSNPKQHIKSIHEKYLEAEKWANGITLEQEKVATQVDQMIAASKNINTYNALTKIIQGSSITDSVEKGTLDCVFDKQTVETAQNGSVRVIADLRVRLEIARSLLDDTIPESEDLISQLEPKLEALSEDISATIDVLVRDTDTCIRQLKSDADNASRASNTPRNLAALSKTALLHTKKFLPTLCDTAIDVGEVLRRVVDRRNSIEEVALHFLQRTAVIESGLSVLQSKIRAIDVLEEEDTALEDLARIAQYPSIYASLLIEVVRRLEWNQKMLQDTSTLAEEMAAYKSEEEKRRRKWQKSVEGFLAPENLSSRVRSIEISITGQEQSWPALSREDINALMQDFQNAGDFENTLQEMSNWIKALDIPPKSQARKLNLLNNGSLSESRFGRNSLLLRGDQDAMSSLRNDKSKLEHQLKSAESRIRKLEDLVHRANQMTRPLTSSGAPSNGPLAAPGMERKLSSPGYAGSPRLNDSPSRRSSATSNRLSVVNQLQVDDGMFQQVLQLEADLANERKKIVMLEDSAAKKLEAEEELKRQVQDAVTMKKDLMDNFQTQQQDFEAERKLLEDKVKTLQIRAEEMEEDYDRAMESHDNTRGAYGELMKEHEEQVETMRADASLQLQRAHDRIGDLQSINDNQRLRLDSIEDENFRNTTAIEDLNKELTQEKSIREEQRKALHSVLRSLNPNSALPGDFQEIVQALDLVMQKAHNQNQDLRLLADAVKGENEAVEARYRDREDELARLRHDMVEMEKEHAMVAESSTKYEARLAALDGELARERETLRSLRSQLPGSESIKTQLAEAENRAEALSLELVSAQALSKEKEVESLKFLKSIEALQESGDNASIRLHDRARRASEVSLLLYLQTDRLTRLLEHIGFSVSREDDAMVIERVARTTSGSVPTEATQNLSRSLSGPVPHAMDSSPPEYLHWAVAADPVIEKDFFEDFVHESRAFDLDAFCEAVIKRIKDTEHIARKWQREARTYRDRHRNSQFEAQHKIAFRAFKEGDLALFLPTRSQAPQRSWAAFNVGAPHYFLREQDKHRLTSRDWLLARITNIEERVVDLSKSMNSRLASGISEDGQTLEDDNPFGLSDGLKWYYLDAEEERTGAPITPGPGKTTVASVQIDAEGSIQRKKNLEPGIAARVLTKSLDSRRSSGNSRKSLIGVISSPKPTTTSSDGDGPHGTDANRSAEPSPAGAAGTDTEEVRKHQLLDP